MLPGAAKEEPAFAPGGGGMDPHHPALVHVCRVRELHAPGAERSCVHAEVDISGSGISYETGDHVALHAANGDALVAQAAALLHQPLDAVFKLSVPPPGSPAAVGLHEPPSKRAVSLTPLNARHLIIPLVPL
jgi:NADPH-ferrihemoprotein reductase